MARAFAPDGEHLVALLDEQEREVVAGLCLQVASLVEPDSLTKGAGKDSGEDADPFDAIVAGLGDLSHATGPGAGAVPDRAFGLAEERDPALDRLFPTGNREDEREAAEFRRFTEQGLRARKHANLMTTVRTLEAAVEDRWRLSRGQAPSVMIALTDVRLVMGERLGLRTDEDAERLEEQLEDLDPLDPVVFALSVYDFLTWLQESLTRALMGELDGHPDDDGPEVTAEGDA